MCSGDVDVCKSIPCQNQILLVNTRCARRSAGLLLLLPPASETGLRMHLQACIILVMLMNGCYTSVQAASSSAGSPGKTHCSDLRLCTFIISLKWQSNHRLSKIAIDWLLFLSGSLKRHAASAAGKFDDARSNLAAVSIRFNWTDVRYTRITACHQAATTRCQPINVACSCRQLSLLSAAVGHGLWDSRCYLAVTSAQSDYNAPFVFLLQTLDTAGAPTSSSSAVGDGPSSSSTLLSSKGSSSLLSSISSFRRRILQPISPNAFNVRPGMLTSSSTTAWATVALDPSVAGASIPSSFLGISHEWTNVEELNHGGSYLRLLKDLTAYGSGPLVVRVGGGSTDKLTTVPPESTFQALRELHESTGETCSCNSATGHRLLCNPSKHTVLGCSRHARQWQLLLPQSVPLLVPGNCPTLTLLTTLLTLHNAGMRFIFGLNFFKLNVSLAVEQMDAILAHLPRAAILAFEVGNEVGA